MKNEVLAKFCRNVLNVFKSVDPEWPGVLALWDTSICGVLNYAAEFIPVFDCRTLTVGAHFEELFTSEGRLCASAESCASQSLV